MRRYLVVLLSLLFMLLTIQPVFASFVEDQIKYGVGVRPLGMGGAFTAVADDINSIYYNPAGLGEMSFGYSLANHDMDNKIYSRNDYNALAVGPVGLSEFRAESISGESIGVSTVALGNFAGNGWSWGVSWKKVLWSLPSGTSWSVSGDVGLLLRMTPEITLGFLGQDLLKSSKLDAPSTGRFGIAYRPFAKALTFAFDLESGRTGGVGLLTQYGVEAVVTDGFKLRAGVNRGRGTAGVTFKFGPLDLEYAYLSNNDSSTDSVQTISIGFSIPVERKRPFSIIRPKEFALIDIDGNLVGGRDKFSFLGGASLGTDNVISQIRRAARDPSIDGILIRISGFDGGIGSIGLVQEIRSEMKRARAEGKKVLVYVDSSAVGDEYYLASAADKIIAPYGSSIGGLGRSLAVTRVRELSDKIGVEWQVLAKGKYKSTFDQFSPDLTKEQKEMLSGLVSDMYRQMITDISSDRGIEVGKVKQIGDGSLFTASDAKKLKLIDKIGYFKDAVETARDVTKGAEDVRMVAPSELYSEGDEYFLLWPYKIAVIEIDGTIVTGGSGSNVIFGGTYVGADTVSAQIKRAADDIMVRAIVLRVNSPGGSSVASGQIYQEILKAREKGKVVVASMGDVAASGGYFVSAGADKIVADPGTITGSIGVIFSDIPVYAKLYKKIGVKVDVVKEGEHADMFSGLRKLSTSERESIDKLLEETYVEFKGVVAKGRGMTTTEVEKLAQGKIYTGSQAMDVKLVDKLGGFGDAVDLARDLAKIPGEPKLIFYREDSNQMQNLLEFSEKLGIKDGLMPFFGQRLLEHQLVY